MSKIECYITELVFDSFSHIQTHYAKGHVTLFHFTSLQLISFLNVLANQTHQ